MKLQVFSEPSVALINKEEFKSKFATHKKYDTTMINDRDVNSNIIEEHMA